MRLSRSTSRPQWLRRSGTLAMLPLLVLPACGGGSETAGPADPPAYDAPVPQLGVNYNGQLQTIQPADLQRSGTRWVRGFVDVFALQSAASLEDDSRLRAYATLRAGGYSTILSLKWDFSQRSFPAPGSSEMNAQLQFLKRLLDRVWMHTDVIVVGNEPFIESRPGDRGGALVAFYAAVARAVRDYGERQSRALPIYVGAFNNLYLSSARTAGVQDLFTFARSEPWIAGVDLHIHHNAIDQLSSALGFAQGNIRADQRILVTEFSLMKHWRSKMGEPIPAAFAAAYGWSESMRNAEYIDAALRSPVPRDEWVAFLSGSYWFENRKHYIRNAFERFRSSDRFFVATYAMRQSFPFDRTFTADTDPWILNGLFANRTVMPDPRNGSNQPNYAWLDDFTAIQAAPAPYPAGSR